ncbi:MAG: thioredoxin domain-containing protein, partial [Bacteroidales bacterium]|nr:thioredoxin domain-containing protein [Bacteroidales bacterium]
SAEKPERAEEESLIATLAEYFDAENGGFGNSQKFPSHSTLLFLLYQLSVEDKVPVREMCVKTLNAMRMRGLNDHLQGGIFRYCVDSEWTIPHFEKMLYDQSMALWIYSLAYRVLGNPHYKAMSESIIRCLEESFEQDGFFITAHDADTGHEEGATYIWSIKELKEAMGADEFTAFAEAYHISEEGNFEGGNHLIRKSEAFVKDTEEKLLAIRRARQQPGRDDKILCGNNALVAIALIQAGRLLTRPDLEVKAAGLVKRLMDRFWDGTTLAHSYYAGLLQRQGFLSDTAALFTSLTLLYESDPGWEPAMQTIEKYLLSFRDGEKWIESDAADFRTVYASSFDHPVPSGVSLAEFGLIRAAVLKGKDVSGIN